MPAPKHNANTASFSVSKLTADFFSVLDSLGPFEPRPHLAVALSGGADSTALLLLARAWTAQCNGTISALIVDHRLRETSTREAQETAKRFDATILTPEHVTTTNNLPEQARIWRYDALTAWCRSHHVLHLLVAHHANDQAETVALHRSRGHTQDGASGMAAVTIRDGVRILRPLLATPKADLLSYLRAQGEHWIEDPTNANLDFKRNALRQSMTAETYEQLLQLSLMEGRERAMRDRTFAKAAAELASVADDHIILNAHGLQNLPPLLATRLLADSLCVVSGNYTRPRKHETEQLYASLMRADFHRATLKHCLIEKRAGELHIIPEPHKTMAKRQPKALAAGPFWWLTSHLT